MIQWFLKRFTYTRELEARVREQNQIMHALEVIKRTQKGIISEWEETETTFSKMTLSELETVMTACVDYQDILKRLVVGDPIEPRITSIFEKYNITWERNTLVDKVIEEAEEYAKNAVRRSDTDK